MAQVALAEEPFQVSIGGGVDLHGAERGSFVAVAEGIGPMTLGAVIPIEDGTCGCGIWLAGKRVLADMVTRGNVGKMGCDGSQRGTEGESRDEGGQEEIPANHRASPARLRNQPPIWGIS